MKILTGNELLSGATVYLDPQGNWVEDIQAARVFAKDETEALEAAMAATKATGRIISLESEDVETINGAIYANRIRERIRSEGPTAPRFDRQHLGEDEHVSI
ncbi:DUF2849 domain-containing protein [Pelagibacterium flavum]|uniref:DUF2849 domain-containing protein n=1 Tax=Pelagibacterium flavum TaxID=2984530 RepID=A0ABY6IWG3_9HYPH|nr:DUF2849 domain-containing protein [Pelagibacterium sp. YIM 151497]MAN76898.1 nitrite reductase [Hyphomicrobiales bacterium]UYQ73722.1 DUF2849 domain-containing protein [Pelagibacterium sp. YIM 151497]|tara:strand:- start:1782 stop:2087 length:306 start_codon:yes stop_codon:yes gene_type:complete